MWNEMKTLQTVFAAAAMGLCLAAARQAFAEEVKAPRDDRQPPRREGREERTETFTDAQKEQVRAILSRYDAKTLTVEKAKAIHEAFRQAGVPGGQAENDVVKSAGFDPEKLRDLDPPPGQDGVRRGPDNSAGEPPPPREERGQREGDNGRREGPQKYSIEQAISDQAQLHTIAFSGLAFVTGDFGACTFIPPGKVCDFFGFQYMRDIDAAQKGHSPMFLDRVAGNVLKTLTDEQRKLFETMGRREAEQLNAIARKRWLLIKAFCRELNGQIPARSQGLNKDAVVRYVGDIFAFDAELSYARAEVFGKIATSFSPEQKAFLAKMKFGDFNTWPEVDMERYKLPRGTDKLVNVAYMTYASEFFSWCAGSVEADTYFCPERHGTYFGGFYMKDMPAMGKRDYDISTSVTGDSGKTFLEVLDEGQRRNITAIPDMQRKALTEVVQVRREISTELRKFLKGGQANKEKVLALGRRYGELDGEMSYYYAAAFAKANKTFTAQQRKSLVKLRNLDGYTGAPAYIYSDPVKEQVQVPDTDQFFFAPQEVGGGAK